MMHFFTFAGKSTNDYGLRISGEATFNAPERKYSEVTVPGRNGTLTIDENSFKNITLKYPAYIITDMQERVRDFANYISSFAGYQRLEDTYSPETYRMAQYVSGLEVKTAGYMNRHGSFDIKFNCKPQRFLKAGEIVQTFTANSAIFNSTLFPSKPLLRVYGTGAGTVGIGSYLITLSQIDGYVDIDCELMDAYKGTLNCNANVSFNADDFLMVPGLNGVTFTGNITQVDITPRTFII